MKVRVWGEVQGAYLPDPEAGQKSPTSGLQSTEAIGCPRLSLSLSFWPSGFLMESLGTGATCLEGSRVKGAVPEEDWS